MRDRSCSAYPYSAVASFRHSILHRPWITPRQGRYGIQTLARLRRQLPSAGGKRVIELTGMPGADDCACDHFLLQHPTESHLRRVLSEIAGNRQQFRQDRFVIGMEEA